MKSVADAEAEILRAFAPVGRERVALMAAYGGHLAEAVFARSDAPAFNNSAMDGYALHAVDIQAASEAAPIVLPIVAESRAGGVWPRPLLRGEAARIFTGAPLPEGADAVEMQENVRRATAGVAFAKAVQPGSNMRARGSDVRAGEPLLAEGTRLGPGEIALLASQEHAVVSVFRKPRVAIVATGDELRDFGEPARPGSIVNSNAYMLCAQVLEAGAEPWVLPVVQDVRSQVADVLRTALQADVVVLSGGVSVGEYDVVRDALGDVGLSLDFWRVAMKPGKPLAFARHGRVPVLGLPGNPASSYLAFELFVRPGLRVMLGDPAPSRPRVRARLAVDIHHKPGRTEFQRAALAQEAGGGFVVTPLVAQSSGALRSIAAATALVEVAADTELLQRDSEVEVRLLAPLRSMSNHE